MRFGHLAGRFFGALSPRPPRSVDVAWVRSVCTDDEFAVWSRQPAHDRRHSVAVARRVQAALAGTEFADDPRWIEAALLHDIGKVDARLGLMGRVGATLAGSVAGHDLADAWSQRRGITRRVGLYLRHPEIGADRIRRCGGSDEAARWAAVHQTPARHHEADLPDVVVAALVAADDD